MLLSRRSYMPDLRVHDQMLTSQNTHDLLTSRRANSERRSENQLLPKNCIFNIINPYFQNDGLRQCSKCKIILCFYCQLNCQHPIKHYNNSYTHIQSDGECKCCELHIPQSYITFIQDQSKRFKTDETLKLCQLFNQTLNDTELFHYFYYPLKEHFTQILDKLDYGEESQMWNNQSGADNLNISDRISETFHDKTFHYKSTIQKLKFLNYLLKKVKDDYVLPKIQDCIPQYLFTFIIQNYHLIYQHMSINNQLSELTITILSIQYRNFKQQFQRFRMLKCQDLINSNFITRNMIREYNKALPDSYKFAYMKELIKKANKIIFDLEFSSPLLYSVVLFILRCVKLGLQLRMFDNLKDVCKVLTGFEKLCRDIEYYNQQKHSGFIQPLQNEQIFNKISEIILLAYFQFKDYKIFRKINKKLNKNQEKQQESLYSKLIHQFYDEPIKQNSMINLIYGTSEQEVETLMRIFINTIIEPNLEKMFYNQQSKTQQKLNLITQLILNEQLFIHSINYFQLYYIKLEDWLIWINNESNSQFELTLFPIIDNIQQFIQDISTKQLYQLSTIVKQLELLLSIKEFIKLREYVLYIENKFKNNEKEFDYPIWEMKNYQKICYQMGVDNIIFILLKVLYKQNIDQKHLMITYYYDIIDLAFNILYCMSALNSSIITQIYQSKNLEILTLLSKIPDINRKVVYFHYQLLFLNGFTVFYLWCFIYPDQVIRHIYNLNEIMDSTYSDSSEISITKATEIVETKIQIYILILSLFQQIIHQDENLTDYKYNNHISQYIYDTILIEIINHMIELFIEGNTSSLQSSYSNILEDKRINNRYVKMSLNGALDQLTIIETEIQQPSNTNTSQQQQQHSYHSINSVGQEYTLKELLDILQNQPQQLSQESKLAILTLKQIHLYLTIINHIVDYQSRLQQFHQVEISEQATLQEKIDQLYAHINQTYRRYLLYNSTLSQIQELSSVIQQFLSLISYTKLVDFSNEKSPPHILEKKDLNYEYSITTSIKNQCHIQQKVKRVFENFMKKLKPLRYSHELPQDAMNQNCIINLVRREFRNKSKLQIGSTVLKLLFNLMQQQSRFQQTRNIDYPHTVFLDQINYILLLQRLLNTETKPFQQIIQENLKDEVGIDEDNITFKDHFEKFLQYITLKVMPQLISNVIYYYEQPYVSLVSESGNQCIIILELIRYFAEGQNSFLQQYVGQTKTLEQILTLLVNLLKSKQISDILRETSKKAQPNQAAAQKFKKMVHQATPSIAKKGSASEYIRQLLIRKKTSQENEFLTFDIQTSQGTQFRSNAAQSFMRVFAHVIITIAEYNQGDQLANQQMTFDYLSKYRVWQVIISILTLKTNENQQNSINTLRLYIFQLILSLLEDPERSSNDFQYIMNLINHKLLEETFNQTYKTLIQFNRLQKTDLNQVADRLTELYRSQLGDSINETLIFDSKMLIKILYQIFKMLNLYASINKEIQQYLKDYKEFSIQQTNKNRRQITQLNESAFQFILNIVGSVEYVDERNQLEIFHFLKPPMCFFLSSESKLQFTIETMDRSNASSKLSSIVDIIPAFMTEMKENLTKYRRSLFQQRLIKIAISQNFHHRQFSILLTLLNFIVLVLIANNNESQILTQADEITIKYIETHQIATKISQILLIFFSLLSLICQLFFRMSIYQKVFHENKDKSLSNSLQQTYKVLTMRDIFQFVLHLVLSIFGTAIDPFFFYIESFCFIYISKTMFSVLEALKLRWIQFLGIFMMLLLILNAYSYIGYRKFTTSFQLEVIIHEEQDIKDEELLCDTPAHCFISLVNLGLRESAGLGAYGDVESYYKSKDYYPRFIFDFSFFIIVSLIMLNIINGIIIDTFADLRDQQQRNEYDINNVCVICSLERWNFEKKGLPFQQHVEEIHNLWNYVAFIVHLKEVGRENMNGIETFIYEKIQNRDMSWTPQQQTKLLN